MSKRFGYLIMALFAAIALTLVACGDDDGDSSDGGDGDATGTAAAAAGDRIEDDEKPLVIARAMDTLNGDPHRAFCDTCQIYMSAV